MRDSSIRTYFGQPATIMDLIKLAVTAVIFLVSYAFMMQMRVTNVEYQIGEVKVALQEQSTTLKAINTNLIQADKDRIPSIQELAVIRTKVEMLVEDSRKEKIK